MDTAKDTQWPRYSVFQQQQPGKPHQYVGSVHAPDPELALLNARDVFVRRPECSNLWVVPESLVFTKTFEELSQNPRWADTLPNLPDNPDHEQTFYVFQKLIHAGPILYIGEVPAPTAQHAMVSVLKTFPNLRALWSWVVPAAAVTKTYDQDMPSMFAPAFDKTPFRDQANFHTLTLLKKLKAEHETQDQPTASEQQESSNDD